MVKEKEENKVAIVTGGSNGIGKSAALLMAKESFSIVISDIDENGGQTVADEIVKDGGQAIFVRTDVTDFEDMQKLIDTAINQYGKLDTMVNNAGIGPDYYQKAAEHDIDQWQKVIDVNQNGVFYGMKCALTQMMKQGFGNIVNVASLAGVKASITGLAYSASKFAVVGMTKSAALEYASKNIRINCVCPSFTDTTLMRGGFQNDPQFLDKLVRSIPVKRFGEPIEIAEAILWLASDKSSFVTGHSLIVDGGTNL